MGRSYDDPRFGVRKPLIPGVASGALNGTVGATILGVYPVGTFAHQLTDVEIYFSAGGTGSTRKLLIGTATPSGGTLGAVGYVGTVTLGTQATATALTAALGTGIPSNPGNTFPIVQPGDAIVVSQLGTDAIVYNIIPTVWGVEQFTNL